MKCIVIVVLGFLIFSCKTENPSKVADFQETKIDVSKNENEFDLASQLGVINLEHKVFEIGSKTHFTDTCAFYFECDCCSGALIFNADSTFYEIDYCMDDLTVRRGKYSMLDKAIELNYGPKCVSRLYNYEYEMDTSAIKYHLVDTLVNIFTTVYTFSSCNDKLQLINEENGHYGIESDKNYHTEIEYLKEIRLLSRF